MDWSPSGWRNFEARQQPDYPDAGALADAAREFAARPALVGPAEIDRLRSALAEAQAGRALLLQGGDCAETFDGFSPAALAEDLRLIEAMARRIGDAAGLPVVRIGRIAGQFAKPRSIAVEERDGVLLPAWRGDVVNGLGFDAAARRPDPARMPRAYDRSAETLAAIRAGACPVFTSHEALLLPFEEALVRRAADGRWHSGSAHFLWIGQRTLFQGSAHVEFARGLANPIGLKCGPALGPDLLLRLLDRLDPESIPGRITLIARMGADGIESALPPLLRAARAEGRPVLWVCDPMHGNTERRADGRKTRSLDRIAAEARAFFAAAAAEGVHGGGIHLEMTAADVAECTGGGIGPGETDRPGRYRSPCDPRLNATQAMALAGALARLLSRRAAEAA